MTDPTREREAETRWPAANLLAGEVSPYLIQHADNPVHWRPWGEAAFAEARALGKPVLLSVGYAACHWCHVMAHESFENPAVAAVMNRLFVNIKVDREERPEVDQIYMNALHALGEQGGWPLTMFLTAEGEPFWGGTYFPPEPRYGRPGFVEMLEAVAKTYAAKGEAVSHNATALRAALSAEPRPGAAIDRTLLDQAARELLSIADPVNGGTRGAPKFPQASLLELHWRAFRRTGDTAFRDHVVRTLERISNGGIYDHIGGGYARYSVDAKWLVPHFEKMLYDNGQLLGLLAHAFAATGEEGFRRRIEETVTWLGREMIAEDGAFAASYDADSEGEEGRFYLWTPPEIEAVLGAEADIFAEAYDITPKGNFEGRSIPNRLGRGFTSAAEEERFAPMRAALYEARAARPWPGRDDKMLADWNGLTIFGLSEAARILERPDYLAMARCAFDGIVRLLGDGDRLAHAARAGRRTFPGLSADYGAMIRAALSLHAATAEAGLIEQAERWAAVLDVHHRLPNGAYALVADDADALIVRLAGAIDEATPSGNALVADALVGLWLATGKDGYRAKVDALVAHFAGEIRANVFGHAGLLNALDSRLAADQVVIVAGDDGEGARRLATIVERAPRLGRSFAIVREGVPEGHPAAGKTAIEGRATAYVCRDGACSLPITEPDALAEALKG